MVERLGAFARGRKRAARAARFALGVALVTACGSAVNDDEDGFSAAGQTSGGSGGNVDNRGGRATGGTDRGGDSGDGGANGSAGASNGGAASADGGATQAGAGGNDDAGSGGTPANNGGGGADNAGSGGTPANNGGGGADSAGAGGVLSAGNGGADNAGSGGMDAGGAGGAGGSGPYCDSQPAIPLPMTVTDHYPAREYFDDSATEFTQLTNPGCPDRPAGAAGECLALQWTPIVRVWVGVVLISSPANWPGPGLCIAEGAVRISLQARGADGGEFVSFQAVGENSGDIYLTTSWQTFEIDISAVDYNSLLATGGVNIALSIVMARDPGDVAAKTIYVDDISWLPN